MGQRQKVQRVRVLVVEDDPGLGSLIKIFLEAAHHQVDIAEDGLEGLELALKTTYDVIVMDIVLPGMSGLEVLQRLRELEVDTPILILSGKSRVGDRVAGLELGGDDYLVKPFAFSELLARIQSLLRRAEATQEPLQLTAPDLLMDLLSRKVYRGTEKITLQPREFSLLEYLVRNKGQVVTRAQIMEHVWGRGFIPSTNVLEVHMCRLREKLERPSGPRLFRTIRGIGYLLAGDAETSH
jgi:two-component system, OmpR family, response regulator